MNEKSMPSGAYRPSLDGLRAICIMLTLANHIKGWTINIFVNFGVDIFFALSGWLITWLLLNDKITHTNLANFYIRRFFRIVPLYYMAVAAYAVAAFAFNMDRYPDILLMTFNPEYRNHEGLIGQAWTLGIEEKFYLIWPATLALLPRQNRKAWIIAFSCASILILISGSSVPIIRGYFGLGAGATMALIASNHFGFRTFLSRRGVAEVSSVAIFFIVVLTLNLPIDWYGNIAISFTSAFLVAGLWLRPSGLITSFLSCRPLPFLGALTYAFYLFHVLFLNAVEVLLRKIGLEANAITIFFLVYGVTVAACWPTHIWFEKPLIRIGRDIAARRSRSSQNLA